MEFRGIVKIKTYLLSGVAMLLSSTVPAIAQEAGSPSIANIGETTGGDIVVTAQRRPEKIRDV
ncbi:hypothetical protein MBENS4_4707, partial [Novosphingobium sp. MBES04]